MVELLICVGWVKLKCLRDKVLLEMKVLAMVSEIHLPHKMPKLIYNN